MGNVGLQRHQQAQHPPRRGGEPGQGVTTRQTPAHRGCAHQGCARHTGPRAVVGTLHSQLGRVEHILEDIFLSRSSLVAQTARSLPAMREIRLRSLGGEDTLEKEMATHSSILDWRILWMEEPGRLKSMGSQRVGHD